MADYKLAVLGGGSWGTTVASLASRNADVMLWARDSHTVADINTRHVNSRYLGEAKLNPTLVASTDIEAVVTDADAVLVAVPYPKSGLHNICALTVRNVSPPHRCVRFPC